MAKSSDAVPLVLPTSPMSLKCPFCGARPFKDCATSSGKFSVVHVERIQAAAQKDVEAQAKRGQR